MKKILSCLTSLIIASTIIAPCFANAVTEKDVSGAPHGSFGKPRISAMVGDYKAPVTNAFAPLTGTSVNSAKFPSSYSLRSSGLLSAVKDQGQFGTCWAHSSATSAENSLAKYIPSLALSTLHTAYYVWSGGEQLEPTVRDPNWLTEILEVGGNTQAVTNLWSQWIGPIEEKKLPYNPYTFLNDSQKKADLKYEADYHLENAYVFDYDRKDFYTDNREEVNPVIKDFIMKGQPVTVSFEVDGSFFDYSHYSSYSNRTVLEANHSVTIIGWDDNFSANNFILNPRRNGAWLVQNSWGEGWGAENGLMWLSYADNTINNFGVFELGSKDNYGKNYHHDTFMPTLSYSTSDAGKPSYAANIFRADGSERLDAVATYVLCPNTSYKISVYKNVKNRKNPKSGTLAATVSGSSEITGYFTVDLDKAVYLDSGELFSVIIEFYNPDYEFIVPVETSTALINWNTGEIVEFLSYVKYNQIKELTAVGESLESENGTVWYDNTNTEYIYEGSDKFDYINSYEEFVDKDILDMYREIAKTSDLHIPLGNFCIKAFTSEIGHVEFSHFAENMPLNEKLTLSSKDGKNIKYSVNGGDFKDYAAPIKITEKTEITATTDFVNCYTKTFKPAKAELSTLKFSSSYSFTDAVKIDESHYVIDVPSTTNQIRFLPISQGEITLNGNIIPSYRYTDMFDLKYGVNEFSFTVTQPNREDNIITVTADTSPVKVNPYTETLILNEYGYTVRDLSNKELFNGDSLSEYAGQNLKVFYFGTERKNLSVPERQTLPELKLLYEADTYNEILGMIPNRILDRLYYEADGDWLPSDIRIIGGQKITSGEDTHSGFRVNQGETVTFKLFATDELFASLPITVTVPESQQLAPPMPEYTVEDGKVKFPFEDGIEYGIRAVYTELSVSDLAAFAASKGVTVQQLRETYAGGYPVTEKQLVDIINFELSKFTWDTYATLDIAKFGGKADIAVRYEPEYGGIASRAAVITVGGSIKRPLGDINGDNAVDANDASYILTVYAMIQTGETVTLTDEEQWAGDVDFSGVIDAADASAVLGYYVYFSTGGKLSSDEYFINTILQ